MGRINVFELVGRNAISMQSGKKLYDKMSTDLRRDQPVEVDFSDVDFFASPFFNASFGLVLRDIDIKDLQARLKIEGLNEVGRTLLNHVINNAIAFHGKDDAVTASINKASGANGDGK